MVIGPGEEVKAWIYAQGGDRYVKIGMSKADGSNATELTVNQNGRALVMHLLHWSIIQQHVQRQMLNHSISQKCL